MKKFFSKMTALVSYSVHDNIWELWLFIRDFILLSCQIHHLKVVLCKSLGGLVDFKNLPLENKK